MNILIVGSGAREHAIAAALYRSPQKPHLFCCGASLNPGIEQMTQSYWCGDICHVAAIIEKAKGWQIDLAIIGPEAPLEKGLADALWEVAIPTVGPKKNLAQIETSKAFARQLMKNHEIPGLPRYQIFHDLNGAEEYLTKLGDHNYVIKSNGLKSGKGVKVAGEHLHSLEEAMIFCREIQAESQQFVIEEKLIGQEFSLMCFCDGHHIISMPVVQDHKRAFEDDQGPNTGGMGSYSDMNHSLPFLTEKDIESARQINESIVHALFSELREKYIGILYGGFMATPTGVQVIEFNARFGDPEALNVLSILESDFVAICQAMVTGNLSNEKVQFAKRATVCKYAVPEGYPDHPLKDAVIDISAVKNKSQLYLASVNATDGKIVTTHSRTAAYVGIADTIFAAEKVAEKEISGIGGPLFHRSDIGTPKSIGQRISAMQRLRPL